MEIQKRTLPVNEAKGLKQTGMELNIIYNTDCLQGLKTLPDNSVDCCVTSPPYYRLRDYGIDSQTGHEETPEVYISKLVDVFAEVYRILKPIGTLWLNIGDLYWGRKGWGRKRQSGSSSQAYQRNRFDKKQTLTPSYCNFDGKGYSRNTDWKHETIKAKDLIGIPWMLAFELRRAGWYLRQDIIWHKPNPMPESVKDRCTKSHEYIFLLAKSANYYFDCNAMREKSIRYDRDARSVKGATQSNGMKNRRDVWTVCAKAGKELHPAAFPETLIADCIKAGCPINGIVLDPFMGSGTTAVAARKLNRNYIGMELNPEYVTMTEKKMNRELGMFK